MNTVVKNYLYPGDKIDTASGRFIVYSFDGHLVKCSEFSKFDYDDLYFVGFNYLKLSFIADLLKESDGNNHEVFWYEERYKI